MDLDKKTPKIATTSKLLTTGVDIPIYRNIVIFQTISSMTEFKLVIGRGTRTDYVNFYSTILDYTRSTTKLFRNDKFDDILVLLTAIEINRNVDLINITVIKIHRREHLMPCEYYGDNLNYFING